MLDVVEVQLEPPRERQLAPPGDLPEAGEARLHAEALALDALVEAAPRPAATSGAARRGSSRRVSTLRIWGSSSRLVRRRKRPTRVIRGSLAILKMGPCRLVQVLELRLESVGVCDHRAELQHPEAALVEADPLLHEEDRAGRVELDGERRRGRSRAAAAGA